MMMMMTMTKDVQVWVVDMDVVQVQPSVESDAEQKTWIPLNIGRQGLHTSLGFLMPGLQNACKQQ